MFVDDALSIIGEKTVILEKKKNGERYRTNFFIRTIPARSNILSSLWNIIFLFSIFYSDYTSILLNSLHAHDIRRRCIRVMPKKFAKLFTTCVGGAHLRRAATRTPQVLRVIRVVHCRLRAHYGIKCSGYAPPLFIPVSQTRCCSLPTE